MGAFNGAEVCTAVGNFLFYQLSKSYNNKDIGLYRDRGLAIFKSDSGFKVQKDKKDIQELFKDNHLSITIQFKDRQLQFHLNVSFNLSNDTYRPFCKTNNEITYIYIYIYTFI